jgi:hypothetical protein
MKSPLKHHQTSSKHHLLGKDLPKTDAKREDRPIIDGQVMGVGQHVSENVGKCWEKT